jgi:EpsD family peptidyl-prolyl cis-trans isomerase
MRNGIGMALAAAALLAGCSSGGKDDPVLAKVGAEQVTASQVETEMRAAGVANPSDPALRKAALDQIVVRKLMAQAAREEKLTQTREAMILKAAAVESHEAGLERTAILAKVAKPTPAEADAFVKAHPEMFAERTGYLIERLTVPTPPDPALIEALKPTKTLEAAEAVLKSRNIAYRRGVDQLDTLRAAPQLTAAIRGLPAGEPFVLPEGGGFIIGVVRGSKVQPVPPADAAKIAGELILAQRSAKAMQDRLEALKKDKVSYPAAAPSKPAKS